ncbi:hypothetical protein QWY16_12285 [Planococcus shenhongbingii]|uniref:DUF6640 family protein n=1 Tax=Planococcus shenhongbingii TaxID=3058398 RepID=UPI0026341A60|nr:DUF6640 family protein [Planococcus sp. N016]WKA57278.1 hypothetical protein QWY16_12285 [Planococcus sp. N016]
MIQNSVQNFTPSNVDQKRSISIGKVLLSTVAGLTAIGGFLADWNRTHLFNPNWPPHAKFHDAWTISVGSLLGCSGLYYLLRNSSRPQEDLHIGTMLPAIFWITQGISFTFPGAKGLESEFPDLVPRVKGVWINEMFASAGILAITGTGYALERSRLSKTH